MPKRALRALTRPKSIASNLNLVAALGLLTIVGLAVQAFSFASSSHRTADRVYEDGFVELVTATSLASAIESHRRIVESAPAEVDRAIIEQERRQLEQLGARIEALLSRSRIKTWAPPDPHEPLARDIAMMIHLGLQTNELADNFAIDMAKATVADYNQHARRVAKFIADYRAERLAQAETAFRTLKAEAVRLMALITASFGLAMFLIVPFGIFVVRQMLTRLKTTHRAVSELARGNLEIKIPFSADRDEIGDVARALGVLHRNARALVEHRAELAERNEELARLSSTLEQRVAERTAEAKEAVSRAQQSNARLLGEVEAKSRAEESLRATNDQLREATRAKSEFLASVSHEIRTPIMGVLGMSDLLLKGTLGKQQRHFAETIAKSGQILLGIVNDILDLSRIDAGKLTLERHDLDVDAFVEDVIQVSASSAMAKGLRLDYLIETDVPRGIVGDGVRLRQILLNLVTNAIKFTKAGGVTVRVAVEDGAAAPALVVRVRDTGIGIRKDQQAKLFNAFSQADASITRQFGGTGLGLVISKNLVQMMGGEIGIESELGVGTEVCFRIPLLPASRDDMAGDSAQAPEPGGVEAIGPETLAGKRIVCVADRPIGRVCLQARLARMGAQVDMFEQADAALAAVARTRERLPDAVIVETESSEAEARRIDVAARRAGLELRLLIVVPEPGTETTAPGSIERLPWPALSRDIVAAVALHRYEKLISGKADATAAVEAPAMSRSAAEFEGCRVLVAEDNPINQEVISEYLGALGCSFVVVENGALAVDAFAPDRFDVVLLDCQMPRMDGYKASRRIREIEAEAGPARLPVIAITANTYDSDREKCMASGMDAILSKPFTQEQLADALRQRLATPRAGLGPQDVAASRAAPTHEPAASAPPAGAAAAVIGGADTAAASRFAADMAGALGLPVIEPATVDAHLARNPRLLARMIDLYGRHTPATIAELRRGLDAGQWADVKAAAHTLKSSSKGLGADRLAALLAALELYSGTLSRGAESSPDATAVAELAAVVMREAETALASLESYRAERLAGTA